MPKIVLAALLATALPTMSQAEVEFSFFSGFEESPHSKVTGTDPGNAVNEVLDFTAGWDGKSLEMPPYAGLRATWWRTDRFGIGIEITHDKVYADDATKADNGFSTLEFTDGLNIATVNAMYRWQNQWGALTPYIGGGIGISVPHVEVTSAGGSVFEYQYGGLAVRWMAGLSYRIDDRWSMFGEYQGTYSMNDVNLGSGGTLKTNIITNGLNIGVSYRF
ncbi:MAG: outer membrane beta-barrel protein [Limimaricola sp.]|uniref:outer membrane protein n=1 Tax=Limimaricola sp. TaxID=2211665 RepID=UPI001D59F0D7|nr:outer membrane beta-barrel protein [Limimaricola sp.]MBI1417096.1 outer membrane beta-barrel protein [Limimaricola sp.]